PIVFIYFCCCKAHVGRRQRSHGGIVTSDDRLEHEPLSGIVLQLRKPERLLCYSRLHRTSVREGEGEHDDALTGKAGSIFIKSSNTPVARGFAHTKPHSSNRAHAVCEGEG